MTPQDLQRGHELMRRAKEASNEYHTSTFKQEAGALDNFRAAKADWLCWCSQHGHALFAAAAAHMNVELKEG